MKGDQIKTEPHLDAALAKLLAVGEPSKDETIARLRLELERTRQALATLAYLDVTNLGSEKESGRPPRYFECRLCGDWNDEKKHIRHADGCPLTHG